MYRIKVTFPFPRPISPGDLIEETEIPDGDFLVSQGYLEKIPDEAEIVAGPVSEETAVPNKKKAGRKPKNK